MGVSWCARSKVLSIRLQNSLTDSHDQYLSLIRIRVGVIKKRVLNLNKRLCETHIQNACAHELSAHIRVLASFPNIIA